MREKDMLLIGNYHSKGTQPREYAAYVYQGCTAKEMPCGRVAKCDEGIASLFAKE